MKWLKKGTFNFISFSSNTVNLIYGLGKDICCEVWFLIPCLGVGVSVSREKSDKEIMREIQAIMRQIASSITYLPCLDEPCKKSFQSL